MHQLEQYTDKDGNDIEIENPPKENETMKVKNEYRKRIRELKENREKKANHSSYMHLTENHRTVIDSIHQIEIGNQVSIY